MKIRTKLLVALSTLPLLIFLLIGIGIYQSINLNKMSNTLDTKYDLSLLAEQIHRGVKNEAISMRNIVIFNTEETVERELRILEKESEAVSSNIALLESNVQTEEQKEMVRTLIKTNEKFIAYKEELMVQISAGEREKAIQLINENGHPIHNEFLDVISTITINFETQMNESLEGISTDFRQQILISSLISLIGIMVVSIFVFRSVWSIATRLNHVSAIMGNVADDQTDLSTKVEVIENDEIGEVATSFNKMVASLEDQRVKEKSLIWSKSNIAEITTSLSGMHNLESLSRTFLSKVAPLIEASHGVFYVKDNMDIDGESVYKLLASYALKERKHVTNTFRTGEGLIGQAVLEKAPIILSDVPSEYVKVKSGLGEAPPLTLYVLPVIFEGDVKAVLEVASFKPFTEIQQSFLEEVVNGLGIILESVMGRIQLARLLEESQTLMEEVQAQSEELQSQQEELRATNEELEEQTQALRQSEEKLQVQQEELEQTNAELNEKADRLEEQNKMFEITNREVENARAELEEKAKQLALSSKYKSEFLANMSHELRTPLNSLLILSKLLADNHDGNLTAKQVEYSKTIYSSGSDLLILINDILDLAKIESGKMEVNPSHVQIQDLIEFVDMSFRPIANEKNVDFNIIVKDSLPRTIFSDEQRIQQILKNLLSNAFKFTEKGEVNLVIDLAAKINEQSIYSFSIVDTGIGIPKEKQELIFQAFQQADGTTSRKYGGTGLGLSICREASSLIGGEIVVESEEEKGSTFTLFVGDYQQVESNREFTEIKDEVAVTKEKPEPKLESRNSLETLEITTKGTVDHIKRLLIVDDDKTQRNSLMELIGDKNVVIKAVSSGIEAIEELKVSKFDCMVLDLGLGDTSGFDLLEKIKANIETENLKVFIYTGRDLTSKEEMNLNKYAHTIIIKDEHSPQRLMDELELFLNTIDEEIEEPLNQDSLKLLTGTEGKKILLVDDDVRNVFALSNILELYGMEIAFAENGIEGIELLEANPEFDLILMDIMMPEMDGYQAIQKIRGNPNFTNLPIIALTAKAMKEDREKCMEAGASDYIVKPIDPDQLISLMRVWLYETERGN